MIGIDAEVRGVSLTWVMSEPVPAEELASRPTAWMRRVSTIAVHGTGTETKYLVRPDAAFIPVLPSVFSAADAVAALNHVEAAAQALGSGPLTFLVDVLDAAARLTPGPRAAVVVAVTRLIQLQLQMCPHDDVDVARLLRDPYRQDRVPRCRLASALLEWRRINVRPSRLVNGTKGQAASIQESGGRRWILSGR